MLSRSDCQQSTNGVLPASTTPQGGAFAWHQTMAQGIAEALSKDILTGSIAPGDRLRETELARRFGTSRGPVREALRTLHARRLVEYEANRGAQVTMLSTEDVEQIYEVRLMLEGFLLARHTPLPADIEALGTIVERMQRHAETGDLPGLVDDDLAFHRHWAAQDANRHLRTIWEQYDVPMAAIFLVMMGRKVVTLDQVPHRHRQIMAAYASKDPQRIQDSLTDHYRLTSKRLKDLDLPDRPTRAGGN